MEAMELKMILIMTVLIFGTKADWQLKNPAFDPKFYKEVLDYEECNQQLEYLRHNPFLALQFIDASAKFPRGIIGGNLMEFGYFHQCLSIDYDKKDMTIKGKYCSIFIEADGITHLLFKNNSVENISVNNKQSDLNRAEDSQLSALKNAYKTKKMMKEFSSRLRGKEKFSELYNEQLRDEDIPGDFALAIRLGICIPKPCTTHQVFNFSFLEVFNFSPDTVFTEDFCRLPNDKPWSPADTAASVIFLFIGILTLICTSYDVIYKFILKRDVNDTNSYLQTFSAYTNGCLLVNFKSGPGALRCLDGIRVLGMLWVVLGHTTFTQMNYLNAFDAFLWIRTMDAIYINAAPMTVDTFFTMAGILLVYTTCGKMNGIQLLRNLPFFYLNRLVRMFPLLATVVLLQASFLHRLSDGPMWRNVAYHTDSCRANWWITLLHLQNFINSSRKCHNHTWYIAIDVQLYMISPVMLFWVLGASKRKAWMALTAGLLATLTGATIYNFENNFVANIIPSPERVDEMTDYILYYYMNVLTRGSPFFVGMVFGYLLHIYRGKRIRLPWSLVVVLWSCAVAILASIFFAAYFVIQEGWDEQFVNNILNSFMRPSWGMAIGWIVFACVHGYGGPVNWFLSLDMWRLPARLCYGVYLFHYPMMFVISDSVVSPVYFSPPRFMFMFIAYVSISFIVSYFATLLIDAPFSTIWKRMFETQKKYPANLQKQIEQVIVARKDNTENGLSNEDTFVHNCTQTRI